MRQSTPPKSEEPGTPEKTPGGAPLSGMDRVPPVTFVGGTGRSGTHIVARLLGRHGKLWPIPVECKFHVDAERGLPALLEGRTTKRAFLRRLRGFWWRGFQTGRMRGMYNFVPRERFDQAVASFDQRFDAEPEEAARDLFWDTVWPHDATEVVSGIVEQSCDTIAQAPTLLRLFPEASFVHVVRDGRDASASRVAQTRGIVYPRTRAQGIEWWERRLREMDAGRRAIPDERLAEVSLDELLADPGRDTLEEIFAVTGLTPARKVRRFRRNKMSAEEANFERWRAGLSPRKRERIDALYRDALDRLEDDGVSAVPLLRKTYERRAEAAS
jgi:Sulfotransferase family